MCCMFVPVQLNETATKIGMQTESEGLGEQRQIGGSRSSIKGIEPAMNCRENYSGLVKNAKENL